MPPSILQMRNLRQSYSVAQTTSDAAGIRTQAEGCLSSGFESYTTVALNQGQFCLPQGSVAMSGDVLGSYLGVAGECMPLASSGSRPKMLWKIPQHSRQQEIIQPNTNSIENSAFFYLFAKRKLCHFLYIKKSVSSEKLTLEQEN